MIDIEFTRKGGTHNVLFTGVGGSIGNATLARLRSVGCHVTAISHVPADGAPIVADFHDDAALQAAVAQAPDRLHSLVFAHGYLETGPTRDITPEKWRRMMDVNLNSIYTLIHAALPRLSRGSAIVIVSSTAGLDHSPIGGPHYTVGKWGLNGLVRHLMDELGPQGIRINSVCPGLVDNPMGRAFLSEAEYLACFEDIPLRRAAAPDEIAQTVMYLLSEGSSFITGVNLSVSGGY